MIFTFLLMHPNLQQAQIQRVFLLIGFVLLSKSVILQNIILHGLNR